MPTNQQNDRTSCQEGSVATSQQGSICTSLDITYLGGHKLGSTTERAGRTAVPHILLTETIISNLDVAIQCKKDVVKLQITVDDTVLVEVLERQADLCGVESVRY